jgi:hypothetical protein
MVFFRQSRKNTITNRSGALHQQKLLSAIIFAREFCPYAKKPKQKHFSGVCNPQSPALQSGKPLSFMRMGRKDSASRNPQNPCGGTPQTVFEAVAKSSVT